MLSLFERGRNRRTTKKEKVKYALTYRLPYVYEKKSIMKIKANKNARIVE